jgi:hypothetical protein
VYQHLFSLSYETPKSFINAQKSIEFFAKKNIIVLFL